MLASDGLDRIRQRHDDLQAALWKASENADLRPHDALAAHQDRACLLDALLETQRALEESVSLQGHYAALLNVYDGGQRIVFETAQEWMLRVAMTSEERVADALKRKTLKPKHARGRGQGQ